MVSFPIFRFLWYRLSLLALRHSIVFNSMSVIAYFAPYTTMELYLALFWLVPFGRFYYRSLLTNLLTLLEYPHLLLG